MAFMAFLNFFRNLNPLQIAGSKVGISVGARRVTHFCVEVVSSYGTLK